MNIMIHSRLLTERKGGPYRYLVNILNELAIQDKINSYYLIGNDKILTNYGFLENKNFNAIVVPLKNKVIFDYIVFPYLSWRKKADICFFPKTTFAKYARGHKVPVFHDIIYFEKFSFREFKFFENLHHKIMIKLNSNFADMNIAVSQFTASRMTELLDIKKDKIEVIHEGVESSFKQIDDTLYLSDVQEKLLISRPFLFFAGSLSPRKNILNILKAFNLIKDLIPHNIYFTAGDSWNDSDVFVYIKKNNLETRVVKLGYLSEEDLVAVYNMADCYLYPSLYEGFGLPILEAQACGCPVITSNVSSCPEVAGDSALIVNPYDINEISDAIVKVVNNKNFRNELVVRGLKNIKRFSWKDAGKEHLNLFQNIIENNDGK